MPFFNFPFYPTANYYRKYSNLKQTLQDNHNTSSLSNENKTNSDFSNNDSSNTIRSTTNKKNNSKNNNSDNNCFLELFGLKLHFDDVLLICLIFFLYNEGIQDDELFLSLIFLLLN